jgi:hypothetical protein
MKIRARYGPALAGFLILTAAPAGAQYTLYYGNFHSHCNLSDDATGQDSGPPDEAFEYARDSAGIDILALTDHTHWLSWSEYTVLQTEADNYTQNGVFVALAGQEHGSLSTSRTGAFGHINFWEASSLIPQYINGDDFRYNLPGTYQWIVSNVDDTVGNPLVASFNHPYEGSGAGVWAQFADFAYDSLGDSGMQLTEVLNGKRSATYEAQYDEALAKGWHVGVLGNQDNHEGMWGDQPNNLGNIPLTGVWMTSLTKADVLEALGARRTFAFEEDPAGDRISVAFRADGNWMGSEYSTAADSIEFEVEVAAPTNIASIALHRNGILIASTGVGATSYTWTVYETPGPGSFYYLAKVYQSDGDRAFTSPIWIESSSTFSIPIEVVNEDDANGQPTHWFQSVTVQGLATVDTDTLSTTENQFFIQDVTGGVMIKETGTQTVHVTRRDNVLVSGYVDFVQGQTFIEASSIQILGSDVGQPAPIVITTNNLDTSGETWEGSVIEIPGVSITAGTWPPPGSGGTVTIDDGSGPATLYIDGDTSLDEIGAPADSIFTVRGIVLQWDPSFPYLSGYRIMPRYGEDIFSPTGVDLSELPSHEATRRTRLHQNSPNPFRPTTVVRFDLGGTQEVSVRLDVFDVNGRLVRTLIDAEMPPGEFEVRWDGRSDGRVKVAAGVYFYRLTTPETVTSRKMVLLK